MNKQVISVLVDNHSGVLTRISSLFGRRGFNIDSLTVSATNDPAVSRITIVVHDDAKVLQQIVLQTARLEETRHIFVLDPAVSLFRELLLLKVEATQANRSELREIGSIYKAKIIDLSPESLVFELTGEPDKIDAFLKMMEGFTILEMCRTGITALERGGASEHLL
ncbi:acetolactate synthase small subunit [Gemmiger sp. An120]|uniref:acetolactate synthase small subunit n=1 Tax=Gemmiger TaxID=204475 RepID=UPI000B37120F|nr:MULTISPECIES: acetolactate synthase small subunit [Gemmiger]MBM6914118.1 acetolactate synthase small subunit [Gemmiger formicilis]OUQ43561.1 acetolactate synthase small subunit [Gemmiger sp. An120]